MGETLNPLHAHRLDPGEYPVFSSDGAGQQLQYSIFPISTHKYPRGSFPSSMRPDGFFRVLSLAVLSLPPCPCPLPVLFPLLFLLFLPMSSNLPIATTIIIPRRNSVVLLQPLKSSCAEIRISQKSPFPSSYTSSFSLTSARTPGSWAGRPTRSYVKGLNAGLLSII